MTGPTLGYRKLVLDMIHASSAALGAYQFPSAASFKISLSTSILLLQVLQAPGLIDLQPPVLSAPPIVTLLRYPNAPTDLPDRLALRQEHLRLSQVVDDLLD
jgi:hypothetical protein